MTLRARERRDEILRLASTTGLASVEDLSAVLGVTTSTIRRDLALLTSQGHLARTYGGAISLTPNAESTLRERLGEAASAKHAIARWAADQVRSGETIALDAGSTTAGLAEELRVRLENGSLQDLTVVTAGMLVMDSFANTEGVTVLALGGRLRRISQAFIGPLTEAMVERLSFDRAFMGADGVHAQRGICEAGHDQTRLKEMIMGRAGQVYVLAHAAKLGHSPYHSWAVMPPRWTLVTDAEADLDQVTAFQAQGAEVVVA